MDRKGYFNSCLILRCVGGKNDLTCETSSTLDAAKPPCAIIFSKAYLRLTQRQKACKIYPCSYIYSISFVRCFDGILGLSVSG